MKRIILIAGITSMILGACTNIKLATTTDDVYANPIQEKREEKRLAALQKKRDQELEKKKQEELAAQKAKDDANPAYQYSNYNKDDYYDYQYASRINRFNNPVNGLGFYDNYYTNSYSYNNNPSMYGSSIYSSYNFWPSSYFGNSCGCGYGSPYSNYGYNPYNSFGMGYGSMYGSPYGSMYGSPYGGYGMGYGSPYGGYGMGYGSPYGGYGMGYGYPTSGNWGYFNSYDANSSYGTYAPRGSHDGSNSGRGSSNPGKLAGGDGYVTKYIQSINNTQESIPKFTEVARVNSGNNNHSGNNPNYIPVNTISNNEPVKTEYGPHNNPRSGQVINNGNTEINSNPNNPPRFLSNFNNKPAYNTQQSEQPIQMNEPKNRANYYEEGPTRINNGGFSNPGNSSPSYNAPRGGGGGGGTGGRPR